MYKFVVPKPRDIISCLQNRSTLLSVPGDGPDGPVLVHGGSNVVGQGIFCTYLLYLSLDKSFPVFGIALHCSLCQGMVQMDLFWSLEDLVW